MPEPTLIAYTNVEIETARQETIAARIADDADTYGGGEEGLNSLRQRYAPGSFGCHEALDRASTIEGLVASHLLEAPAIALNPDWYRLAHEAHTALWNLYQSIGVAHLTVDEPRE